jgi:hypothetical protein
VQRCSCQHELTWRKVGTMSRFTVEIDTANAAFDEDPGLELARILRNLAGRMEETPDLLSDDAPWPYAVRDVNGNTVGTFGWAE